MKAPSGQCVGDKMKKTTVFGVLFVFVCAVFLSGCISPFYPGVTWTPTAEPPATATATPTALPYPTVTVNPTPASTPGYAVTPTPWPASAPIYTVSCTFSPWILDSTGTVITDISGNITNTDTGVQIFGNVTSDVYQFTHVSSGNYEMVIDVQYMVYYTNNSTSDRSARITDSFGVNGNVDKTYALY